MAIDEDALRQSRAPEVPMHRPHKVAATPDHQGWCMTCNSVPKETCFALVVGAAPTAPVHKRCPECGEIAMDHLHAHPPAPLEPAEGLVAEIDASLTTGPGDAAIRRKLLQRARDRIVEQGDQYRRLDEWNFRLCGQIDDLKSGDYAKELRRQVYRLRQALKYVWNEFGSIPHPSEFDKVNEMCRALLAEEEP